MPLEARFSCLRNSAAAFLFTAFRSFFSRLLRSSASTLMSCDLRTGSCGILRLRKAAAWVSRSRTRPAFFRKRPSNFSSFLSLRLHFRATSPNKTSTLRLDVRNRWIFSGAGLVASFDNCRLSLVKVL